MCVKIRQVGSTKVIEPVVTHAYSFVPVCLKADTARANEKLTLADSLKMTAGGKDRPE